MKLAVVVNPHARGVRRDPRLPARLAALVPRTYVTRLDGLDALARELADIDVLALCGGDGTTHAMLSAIARVNGPMPRIALLGGGTINTIARNLGVRGDPEMRLARLVGNLHGVLSTTRQTILRIDDGKDVKLGFLFAALLGARFLARYYDHPSPSPMRALRLAAGVALSALGGRPSDVFAAAPLELEVDGTHRTLATARLLVASTIPDVGVGMRITPRAHDRPERFQLVAAGITPAEMARQIPAVQAGRALQGEEIVDALCSRVAIVFTAPEPYTLDGDLYKATRLTISTAGPIEVVRI